MVDPCIIDLSSDLRGVSNRKLLDVMRNVVWTVYRLSWVTVSSGLIPTHRVVMGLCRVSSLCAIFGLVYRSVLLYYNETCLPTSCTHVSSSESLSKSWWDARKEHLMQ